MKKYLVKADDITLKILNSEIEARKLITIIVNTIDLRFNKGKRFIEIDNGIAVNPDKIKALRVEIEE